MEVSLYEALQFVKEQPGLYAFLNSEIGLYSKFVYNCTHYCNNHYNIYRDFKIFSPISSFEWAKSPEGSDYWSNIHDKFKEFRSEL